ncbi:hypothetical protein [Pseudomonas rubra]|uniref:Uncharacterized protein n=1 Tax=Pseudomonas rubra TaxID=2942627 RepID=A0ABT5PEZ0_9PSED|nr:hypothetical protein [Pseudomonas rubra]MDD1016871.1 hypothetical protein [Pseudomonas rubra]MDD1039383.1 hypothetical protein [Pseudomonas rubra]MDD1157835.1 hypothetical protein [Pseudomonas rubra]
MHALRNAQWLYDHAEPEPANRNNEAARVWVDNAAGDLLEGRDVTFQRRLRAQQGVTLEQFAVAVDEFVMGQLSVSVVSPSALGRLVLAARRKDSSEACSVADEVLDSLDPEEALRGIARNLLQPLAADALIAQAEDAEL